MLNHAAGEQARNLFLRSNVPLHELSRIWLLSDINQDQRLDRQEFAIAMFLIRCRLQGREIPTPLPEALIASARDDFVPTSSPVVASSKDNKRYDIDLGDIGGAISPAITSVPSNNPTSPVPPGAGSLPNISAEGSSISSLPGHLHPGGASSVPSLEGTRRFNSANNLHAVGSHQGGVGGAFLSGSVGTPAVMSPAVSSAPAVLQPGAPQFTALSPTFGSVQIVPSTVLFIRIRQFLCSYFK